MTLNKQIKLLKDRNKDSAEQLLKINANHQFDENKKKADYVISNTTDLKGLSRKVNIIINELQYRLG